MKLLKAVALFIAAALTTGVITLYSLEPVNQYLQPNLLLHRLANEILEKNNSQATKSVTIEVFAGVGARIKWKLPLLTSNYKPAIEKLKENLDSPDILIKLPSAKALEQLSVKEAGPQIAAAYRDIIMQALKKGGPAMEDISSPNRHIGEALHRLAKYRTPETAVIIREVLENPALNKAKPIWYSGSSDFLKSAGKTNYVPLRKSEVAALLDAAGN